ncbi:MAG: DUF4330 domain-containing protein [Clostridiales bacterium]|jgi:hypothetical protein|nr:DUF4330 domain-containing protein [Clostridiales bacterium]
MSSKSTGQSGKEERELVKNGKLFGLFNLLDIIVVLLIAGMAASFLYKRASRGEINVLGEQRAFYVTYKVEKVRDYSLNAIEDGDVFFEQHAQVIGKVVRERSETSVQWAQLLDGTIEKYPMEDKYDLYLTLEASGTKTSGGYFINGNNQVAPGRDMAIQSNKIIMGSARVYAVSDNLE